LTGYVRLAWVEPGLFLLLLGAFAPTLAAFLAMGRDKSAWMRFVKRFNPFRLAISSALRRYFEILLVMTVLLFVVFYIRSGLGLEGLQRRIDVWSLAIFPSIVLAAFFDLGGVLEEGGWRGFAQPEMERQGWTPLKAALLIGVIWGLWHVPRDVVGGVFERYGFFAYVFVYLPSFLLNTVASAVLAAFFMHRLNGSIWPAVMVHGLVNDVWSISGIVSYEQTLSISWQLSKAIPLVILTGLLIYFVGWQRKDVTSMSKLASSPR
jgi:membrane protease YdiL (CAAX protease family)